MRAQNRSFRLTALLAVTALLSAQLSPPAAAQPAPPPPMPQQGDPPARVGRLAQIAGTVSFHTQDETSWNPAVPNYPVTAGNSFWTQPGAQASIEVSASRVVMAPQTELDISNLTNTAFQATLPQGEAYLHVQAVTPDETYAVQTPRGLVTFASPGRYGVVAGDTQDPTEVTVIQGSAHIDGPGVTTDVAANQTGTISGTDSFQASVSPAQPDAFLTAILKAERPAAAPPPPVVASMPGGEDLSAYGTWSDTSDYGEVWYPQVAPDWVPYREGQWAYVEPWGWTWVDSDPWGFAPFHYGRWAEIGGRWGWVPGAPVAGPPVYAPALVTFFGIGAAVGVGIGAALAAGSIGWCPLGPREAYRPWYHASPTYLRDVNIRHVTNITTINRNVTVNNFVNRSAATVVPTSALTNSRPVGRIAQRVDPTQLARARPLVGTQPVRPAATTVGVTPVVARQFNLPAAAAATRPVAPGPAIHATTVTAHPATPALHTPAQNSVPAAAAVHPALPPGTPMLRPPVAAGHAGPPPIEHTAPIAAPGAVPHVTEPPTAASHPISPILPVAPGIHPVPAAPGAIQPHHVMPTPQAPTVHAPPAIQAPAPAVVHTPTTQAPIVHAPPAVQAPPAAIVHTPTPAVVRPPEPQVHAPPVVQAPPPVERPAPPVAVVHPTPPPPVVHALPPAVHVAPPPPAPHPAPAQNERKKPGEP
jgi:uncharacterized protein DUF6600